MGKISNDECERLTDGFEDLGYTLEDVNIPKYQKDLIKKWAKSIANADYVFNSAVKKEYARSDFIYDMIQYLGIFGKKELTINIGFFKTKKVPIETIKQLKWELNRYRWNAAP